MPARSGADAWSRRVEKDRPEASAGTTMPESAKVRIRPSPAAGQSPIQATTYREAVFSEGGRLPGETRAKERHGAVDDDPTREYFPHRHLQRHDDVAHGKATMIRTRTHKYVQRLFEGDQLYDLVADPRETVNCIADPACAAVLADLRDRLARW